jgi:heterotetrameric sarcosine oxidase gamma subunit
MAIDGLQRRTPLGPMADRLRESCSGVRFSCVEVPYRVVTDVQCAPAALASAAETLGILPPTVGAMAMADDSIIIGLGPRWWMVDAPDGSAPLRGSTHVSAVEVSAQHASLQLGGASVRDVLAHGTTSDLHPDHLRHGSAIQSILANIRITLARTGHDEFRLWVPASYARSLANWFLDASLEYR